MKQLYNSKGFSMLEILVALVLAGLIMTSMFQSTVHFNRSVQRNEERIRALYVAASVSEWWRRLPTWKRSISDYSEFSPVPTQTGLRFTSQFEWRIETDDDSVKHVVVRSPRSGAVRLPVSLME
jgi:prepilin-type N-terminal cleavage/methylation domain-containing protein